MNRRTQGVLLVGSVAAATAVLAVGLARGFDHDHCKLISAMSFRCTVSWSSSSVTTTTTQSSSSTTRSSAVTPGTFEAGWYRRYQPGYADVTAWAVTPDASVMAPDGLQGDLSDAAGLPLPRRWVVTTANNSPFNKSVHVETPLDLAAVLGFYRAELSKRGWTENDGAVVEPDRGVIAFTTTDGPALLRLIHQDDRTIADLSLRKSAANAGILPTPGQVRLLLGNATGEEAAVTINEQTVTLAARTGRDFTDDADAKRRSPESPEIDLQPGKYKVTLKVASSAAQDRELEVAADETWGLLVGPAGIPLPVHLY
jgi:hypothetical protein